MRLLIRESSRSVVAFIRERLRHESVEIQNESDLIQLKDRLSTESWDHLILGLSESPLTEFEFLQEMRGLEDNPNPSLGVTLLYSRDHPWNRLSGFESGSIDFVERSNIERELIPRLSQQLESKMRFSGIRVVLVEDSLVIRRMLQSNLIELGVEVMGFDDGEGALEYIADQARAIDLVITDSNLKRLHGLELIRCLRKEPRLKNLPVISIVPSEDRRLMENHLKAGANDILQSPFWRDEFVARIQNRLECIKLSRLLVEQSRLLDRFKNLKTSVGEANPQW